MSMLKRVFAVVLTLVMMLGLFPADVLTPAYADNYVHTQAGGFTFGGNSARVTNKVTTKTGTMGGINNHLINGGAAFCIDPTLEAKAGHEYTYTGTGNTSSNEYWGRISAADKRTIAGIATYYYYNPNASYLTPGTLHKADVIAKVGAQYAIFRTLLSDPDALGNKITATWDDVKQYAADAVTWANSQTTPSATIATPSFNQRRVELQYNASSGKYEGTVTDSNGALSAENYNFTQTVSGIQVTQNGNTVTITATPEAAVAAGLQDTNNRWSVSSTATKDVTDPIDLNSVSVFEHPGEQPMIQITAVPGTPIPISQSATLYAHAELIGSAKVVKSSSDTSISNNNSCYSLTGAEYGIYRSSDNAYMGSLTTDASGQTGTIDIPVGSYYAKEITAPSGFALDPDNHSFTVTVGQTATVNVSDIPTTDPVAVLLKKIDAITGQARPAGNLSLAGAEYTIKFYGGQYSTAAAAEASGSPLRSWVVKTNSNGFADIRNTDCLVSGDDFWYASNGSITFPLGTVVIYETKAPTGYKINDTKYVVNITEDGQSASTVRTYNEPEIPEQPYMGGVKVTKIDSEMTGVQGDASFADAKFDIINMNNGSVTVNGVEVAENGVALTITTNASGVAESGLVLPYGSYRIKESAAPTGYQLNSDWFYDFAISSDGQVVDAGNCADPVIRGGLSINKTDADLGTDTPYGDASFEGFVFSIANASDKAVIVNGTTYQPGAEIMQITTNSSGKASTENNVLPYGKYKVTEVSVPADSGYGINSSFSTIVTVSDNNALANAEACPNPSAIHGAVSVQKIDALNGNATPQGDASLAGAVFEIINRSANSVFVNGDVVAPGDVVTTITSNNSGVAASEMILPMGTYEIKEMTASTGYVVNTGWSQTAVIRENGQTVSFESDSACPETLLYGGISVQKLDSDTMTASFSLAGAEIAILNASDKPVIVDGVSYAYNEIITKIVTNENGVAETAADLLPYGSYTLAEVKAPHGYGINTEWRPTVKIREAKQYLLDGDNALIDEMARGDIYFIKVDGTTMERLRNIPFKITNQETGESHIAVTDFNGVFDSSLLVKTNNTNGNDAAINPDGSVNEDLLDSSCGIWFNNGDPAKAPDQNKGAFPMGVYTFEELPVSANSVYELVTFEAEIIEDAQHLDVGTVDDNPKPHVATNLLDKDSQDHIAMAGENVTLVDTLNYYTLRTNKTYEISGTLVDQATGDPILVNGEKVTATTGTFRPHDANGVKEMKYNLDASALAGKTVVSAAVLIEDGVVIFEDNDLSNSMQTVYFPEIGTMAHGQNGEKEFVAGADTVVIDTVSFENLIPNTTYVMKSKLVDNTTGAAPIGKDGAAVSITAETTFTPTSADGTVDVEFHFNASKLGGVSLVAFERLTRNSVVIARHEDLDDVDQTISIPRVETTLVDENNAHITAATATVTLTDTVSYGGLKPGVQYTMTGTLMNKATGDKAYDANGQEIVASTEFTPDASGAGIVELTFTFDGTNLAGESVVAFEEVTSGGYTVAGHLDIDDEDQTVDFPKIGTTAASKNGDKEVLASNNIEIVDEVRYENLIPDQQYTLVGELRDSVSGEAISDATGNPIAITKTFTATSRDGSVSLSFKLDASALAGKTAVAFETLSLNGVVIAEHKDLTDEDQSVNFPKIGTMAADENGSKEILAGESVTLVDTVSYENLIPGKTYYLSGELMDKATGRAAKDANGDTIVASTSFRAENANGTASVHFVFNTANLENKTLVVFETLKNDSDAVVAEHKDINDVGQSVTVPKIGTVLTSEAGSHVASAVESVTLTDTIRYSNLIPGNTYKAEGKLIDKATGEAFYDADGHAVVAESTFTAEAASGTATVTFTFNASGLEGSILVAYEQVSNDFGVIAKHENPNDEDQIVYIPDIRTSLVDRNGEKEIFAQGSVTLVDTVEYKGLRVGEGISYSMEGALMDKETGEAILVDGQPLTQTVTFTPNTPNGTIDVVFKFSADSMAGKVLVAYEKLSFNGELIAKHEDIDDHEQTVWFPEIGTTAHDADNGKEFLADEAMTVIDTIAYKNLTPGKQYVVNGRLMDKSSGQAAKDINGNEILANTFFTANETGSGTVDVEFSFNGTNLEGKTLVAYERVYLNSTEIARHEDISDVAQTITIPKIRTTLVSENGDHQSFAGETITLTDTLVYENLIPGKTYTIEGALMDKATGEAVVVDGEPITARNTVVPDTASGSAEMTFTFKAEDLAGTSVVAFEKISNEYGVIARHEDLTDEDQTVKLPKIRTSAATANGDKEIYASKNVTIVDTVRYENLIPGAEYVLNGTLVDKATGETAHDDNGRALTATATLKPDKADGSTTLSFTGDMKTLEGKTLVAFEELTCNGVVVAEHKDIDDAEQTVTFPKIRTTANDAMGGHESEATEEITIVDTVRYTNLDTSKQYIVSGVLMDKATGREVKDANGDSIVAYASFTPEAADGAVDVTFTFNGVNLATKTIVAFETLTVNNRVVATHTDITDEDQTITIPKIGTTLVSENGDHQSVAGETVTLTDTVTFKNLIPGKEYTFEGTLMNRATGEAVVNDEGEPVKATSKYTPTDANGSTTINFVFNAKDLEGLAVVAFEQVSNEFGVIARHEDLTDDDQTVWFPKIRTNAFGKDEDKEVFATAKGFVNDTVAYWSLIPGTEYTLSGILMDKTTGAAALDANGNTIEKSISFKPTAKDGSINLTFNADLTNLAGHTLVVYETLTTNGDVIAEHKDLEDISQTVTLPKIWTTAHSTEGSQEMLAEGTITIVDTVHYENLIPGKNYTVSGTLMDKRTGSVLRDKDGNQVTAVATFVPEQANGEVDVTFTFDASNLKNATVVAFESLNNEITLISEHKDIDDEAQTIRFPEIGTTLLTESGTHVVPTGESVTVTDTVIFHNLKAGKTYTVTGSLMDKETGFAVLGADNQPITVTKSFTAEASDGAVELSFTINSELLGGKKTVAVEELANEYGIIATHKELTDEDQSAYIPKIGTSFAGKDGEKEFMAEKKQQIIDTVTYEGLLVSKSKDYQLSATLMDKATNQPVLDKNGNQISMVVPFAAKESEGSVQVVFNLENCDLYEGHTLVAFESLYYRGELITTHNDGDQTVTFPLIRTNAHDEFDAKEFLAAEEVTIVDTVSYKNLVPGAAYTLEGQLYDAATKKPAKDANGDVITASTFFTPETADGTVDVTFTFDASNMEDKTLVVFETLSNSKEIVAKHQNITDTDQTVTFPKIRTTLRDENNEHVTFPVEELHLIDTVVYSNLVVGKTYTVTGVLMHKDGDLADTPVLDAEGNNVAAQTTFAAESANGTVDVEFVFDARELAGQSAVAYETLSNEYKVIAKHEDIDDKEQTEIFPELKTTFADRDGNKELFASDSDNSTLTLVDTVEYRGLLTSKKADYKLIATLMDKATDNPIMNSDGTPITAETTFAAKDPDGTASVTFLLGNIHFLAGRTVVAFESLYYKDVLVADHNDLEDENQTVTFPAISTTAHDENNSHEFLAGDSVALTDTVSYKNLIPGNTYRLEGKLMEKVTETDKDGNVKTAAKEAKDAEGEPIVKTVLFIPETADGTVDVVFEFNGVNAKNKIYVAYEELFNTTTGLVARHNDIEDQDQSTTFPEIRTTLADTEGSQVTQPAEELHLIDTVLYSNLVVGKEYTAVGTLVYKNGVDENGDSLAGKPVLDADGNEITAKTTFTAETSDGSVDVEFVFDASALGGKAIVAFESLSNEFGVVAEHKDIDDEDQTEYFPEIKTMATGFDGAKDLFANTEVLIRDTVSYTNLKKDVEYTFTGKLMDKETGEPILDANGDEVTSSAKVVVRDSNGSVTLDFTFDASELSGKNVVVFERVFIGDYLVAVHEDLEDEDQTVLFPEIGTTLLSDNGSHVAHFAKHDESGNMVELVLTDTIAYKNLIPGVKYEVRGYLVDRNNSKFDEKPFTDTRGNIVLASKEFTPETADGEVSIDFVLNTPDLRLFELENDCLVAYESLYHAGRLVAEHKDLEDEDQAIHFPSIRTSAKAENGTSIATIAYGTQDVTITDTVTYENLVPGLTYKMGGMLMNPVDHGIIRDENGDPILAETEFTPEEANGTVDVVFTFSADIVYGMKTVVFENLWLGQSLVADHSDYDDEAQTVTFPYITREFKHDASDHHGLVGAVFKIVDKGLSNSDETVPLIPDQEATSDQDGYFFFNTLPGHQYSVTEIKAPDGYLASATEFIIDVDEEGFVSGDTEIPNVHGGTVVITKTDVITGTPLPGCEISIYKVVDEATDERELVFKQTTDNKGRIYFYTLEKGIYVYKETATRDGYYLNEDEYVFIINEDLSVEGEARITNVPFGCVVVKKVDTEGRPLAGAQLAFYDQYDRYLGQGVSDAKGRVYFMSPGPGDYYFTEVKAPEGYGLVTDHYHFRINSDFSITGALTLVNGRGGTPYTKTGDTQNLGLWLGIALASLLIAGGTGAFLYTKKRKSASK